MPVKRGGTMIMNDDVRRFWSKTLRAGQCFVWTGARDRDGYGKFMTGRARAQTTHRPHRWIFERVLGPLNGRNLLHSCDEPACVTLQHLSPGTQKQNVADCIAKGRFKNGSRILTEQQAAELKWLYANGATVAELAQIYGLSLAGVRGVTSGINWARVEPRKP